MKKKFSRSPSRPPADDISRSDTSTGTGTSPSLPVIVAASFDRLDIRQRARMLGRLLAPIGPLALAVVGGGVFAKYATHARWPEIPVSIEDAARATSAHIHELVRYIEQSNPQAFNHLLESLARDSATITALGASIAALTINRLGNRSGSWQDARPAPTADGTEGKPGSRL